MAWKLDEATFVQGDNGLAYSVSLYERLEASNGEVFMARKGPLTEAQAQALGFDLADVLATLNTSALASLDAARDDASAKAQRIIEIEGSLKAANDERDSLMVRLAAKDEEIATLTGRVAELEAAAAPPPQAQ